MDWTSSEYRNHITRNPCSLNDALHNVDQNLVYDPITKKLCLKIANKNNYYKNDALPKQSKQANFSKCDSESKLCPSENFTNDLHNNPSANNVYASDSDFIKTSSDNSKISKNLIKKYFINKSLDFSEYPYDLDFLNEFDITFGSDFHIDSIKRPENLPPKDKKEELKHRAQFLKLLQYAKVKDLKEKKLKQEVSTKQVQQENEIQKAIKIWTDEILPCWTSTHITKRVHDLWWQGIPSPIRSRVWNLVIGNDLHITEQLFYICLRRSKEKIWTKQFLPRRSSNPKCISYEHKYKTHRRTHSFNLSKFNDEECTMKTFDSKSIMFNNEKIKDIDDDDDDGSEQSENIAFLIKLDVLRTFPQLGLFQEMGPYHESLCDILSAYVVYRPDIGYCQGMSFLAAMLLLNSESPSSAFISLANLLNNELLLAFYDLNQHKMQIIYSYYDRQFHSLLPNLARHFADIGLSTDLFFMYQVYTIFARSLSLDCVSRVWDLFLRDGNEFIFRASLGILSMYQKELSKLEFVDSARFLSSLPEDMDIEKYFEIIATIKLIPPKLMMADNNNTTITNNNKSKYTFFTNKFLRF